jgi:signal transduction histidine kinase
MNARVLADELAGEASADQSLDHIIREIDRMDLYLQELLSLAADSAGTDGAGTAGTGQGGAGQSGAGQGGAGPRWARTDGAEQGGVGASGAGQAQAAPPVEPVNLGEQVTSVLKLLAGRCEHAGVIVETNYSPAAGLALADSGRIRQVILNLALNALDAMPHGGRLSISVMPAPAMPTDTVAAASATVDAAATAAPAVRLEITDTGPGVRAAQGVDIFEPFITTKPQGTGLGLYICRRIIESLHGQLGYRDGPQGVTFWFELPAAPY